MREQPALELLHEHLAAKYKFNMAAMHQSVNSSGGAVLEHVANSSGLDWCGQKILRIKDGKSQEVNEVVGR